MPCREYYDPVEAKAYREANLEHIQEYHKRYREQHRAEMVAYNKAWCQKNKRIVRRLIQFIRRRGCARCPENRAPCLDFHHRDPTDKVRDVSTLFQKGRTPDVVWAEIQKCDLICANCHRVEHAKPVCDPT